MLLPPPNKLCFEGLCVLLAHSTEFANHDLLSDLTDKQETEAG